MSKQEFLEQYLINFDYLDAIILSDKDGIELYSAYKLNQKAKLQQDSLNMMLCTAFQQASENINKLSQNKIENLTLYHDEITVFICVLKNLILTIFCDNNVKNLQMLDEIQKDLQIRLEQLDIDVKSQKE